MIRLQILSDVHWEFHKDDGASFIRSIQTDADVLIIAGDLFPLCQAKRFLPTLQKLCKAYPTLLWVLGNHEYYGTDFTTGLQIAKQLTTEIPNLHLLHRSDFHVGQVRFIGCTLWFQDEPMNPLYAKELADFDQIRNFVPRVYTENTKDLRFLNAELEGNGAEVVITHHVPSFQSVPLRYQTTPLNRFFVCPVEHLFGYSLVWIHGHTHDSFDYVSHGTRVVCNPLGYPFEATQFNDVLTIEV